MRGLASTFKDWLAWGRRGRENRVLFSLSVVLAAFVTLAFGWATIYPDPGNSARYFAFYWVWGLCAVGVLLAMAEYKTSPLRKRRERGHLFILLYIGALLIVTRALNAVLYYGP
ncbi:MAG: hypothetical protein H0X19_07495 [Rubrobacter sp.]|nr:hypothetical protein [Rubrobacter sp.]